MNTENFTQLIRLVTGRDFTIQTNDLTLQPSTKYRVYRITPIKQIKVGFDWVTPKTDEKYLRSFITSFCNKYREPNPEAYNHVYGGKQYYWNDKTEEQKEYAYFNHSSNMYSKTDLMQQIETNFASEGIKNGLIRYGFYPTEYGIGIFCFWLTDSVQSAIVALKKYLESKGITYGNEFSDAKWVYRFKLNLSKELHSNLIIELNK
jgi:hypothetical protein